MLGKAIALASELFKDTKDKGGNPYILHCIRVMNNLHTDNEVLNTVAILHDVLEDSDLTEDDLKDMGFPMCVRIPLRFLTHEKSVPYEEYIEKISFDDIARKVKLADLMDNSDITRLKGLTKKDFKRIEKYHKAFVYLSKI